MHARADVDICRLARFSAIAILMIGTIASAGEIIITIDDALYYEHASAAHITKTGDSIISPEFLMIHEPFTYDLSGHEYKAFSVARTTDEGPKCETSIKVEAKDPGIASEPWLYGANTWEGASSHTWTEFDFVVYNTFGTETELLVPIIAEGILSASLYHEEYGTIHAYLYLEPWVEASAFVEFYHHNDPWDAQPIAAEYAYIQHGRNGVVTTTYAMKSKPWLLTVPVWVGKNPGDRAYYTVRLGAWVNGTVTAYSPRPTNPERLFYSTVSAFADAKMVSPEMEALRLVGRSAVDAEAAARPAIYIDPTWEHADKFAVAFPDNLTPLTEEWDGLVFADDFESAFTLRWSSTVQ